MVAPQITQEKKDLELSMDKPTEVAVAERGRDLCGRRGLFGLFFYAGAITAALIVVIALGSMYQHQTRELCDSQQDFVKEQCSNNGQQSERSDSGDEDGESKHLKLKNGKNEEDDDMIKSKNGRYETVYSRHANSSHPVISVIDNQRGMTGIYFSPTEECYLMGGKAHDGASGVEPEDHGVAKYNDDEAPNYEVLYDEEIKDKSLLPRPLQKVCHDKPTYWMQRQTSEEHQRKKRGTYYFRVCITYSSCYYYGQYYSPCRICFNVRCTGPTYARCRSAVCARYGGSC